MLLKYRYALYLRNTFIDNDRSYGAIQSQLKKSIEIAKKTGYAMQLVIHMILQLKF